MTFFSGTILFFISVITGGLVVIYINLKNPLRSKKKFIQTEEDGIKETVNLFNKSKRLVKIVGGELNSNFYNNPEVIKSIENALERKVNFEILCGPTLDNRNTELFKLFEKYNDQIDLFYVNKRENNHYRVVDDLYIYLEKYHKPLQENRNALRLYNNKTEAIRLEKKFDQQKDSTDAKLVNFNKIWEYFKPISG